jgi:anti-sigma factor RsiW
MHCEMAQEQIVTAAYDELGDEQRLALEQHLASCAECAREREQVLALQALADAYPALEPDANLIVRSRLRLEAALDALPPRRWYERLGQRLVNNFAGLQAVPVAACLLLAVGVGSGLLGGYRLAAVHAVLPAAPQTAKAAQAQSQTVEQASAPTEVASISSIVSKPESHRVEVLYNRLVPQQIEGSLDDPAIRQLLMLASKNAGSAGVRGDSMDLLAAECKVGHNCSSQGIRDALLVALRTDKNAGVREKALHGLEPYVAEDVRVRNAVLEALLNDGDPKIRTVAINLLAPVEGDTSVRQVLHSVADTDRNPYIRTVSRQVLTNEPEIQ